MLNLSQIDSLLSLSGETTKTAVPASPQQDQTSQTKPESERLQVSWEESKERSNSFS